MSTVELTQRAKEDDDTPNEKESKPSLLKFKRQSVAVLSPLEWLYLILSIFVFGCAAALSIMMFAEEKPDSPKFVLTIVLGITAVFLLVYPVHGVFWRMPYSLLLHCLCNVVLVAYYIMYCYTLLQGKASIPNREQIPNGDQTSKIVILVLGTTASIVELLLALYLFRKYWQARTMTFPWGAETHGQDENVKHLFLMCSLLLAFHLELTFVVFVLKIGEIGLATVEIVKLVGGVVYSTSMCVLGFWFLFKKWQPLVFVIPLASLIEVAHITYSLINTGQNWQGFPDEVVPAFIIAVSIANLAVRSFVCWSLIYIYKHIRTEVDEETTELETEA